MREKKTRYEREINKNNNNNALAKREREREKDGGDRPPSPCQMCHHQFQLRGHINGESIDRF